MATPKTGTAPIEPTVEAPTTKTLTNWAGLKKFFPTEIVCQTYPPYHKVDLACHTRLRFDVEQIKNHVKADHSGGFQLKLRNSDKDIAYWDKFSEADLESVDFRCEICDKQVPFHVNHILAHMRPHTGKSRRVRDGGLFNITLRVGAPALGEVDAFEQNG